MQMLHHQKAVLANVDKTKASRKNSLSEEYSLGFVSSDEFAISERTQEDDVEFVHSLYQEILLECRFVSQENLANIPRFSRREVIEGLTLGKGGFGTINELKGFSLNTKEERRDLLKSSSSSQFDFQTVKGGDVESKKFMAKHCFRNNGDTRYAVKRLQKKTLDDDLDCLRGTTDLANETLFLGSIDHPHIIKLRGIATDDICDKDFFIILDRLYDTLASRLAKWKAEEKQLSGLRRIFRKRGPTLRRKNNLLGERLSYASQLASALTYLHHNRIIHRDLKPENIGFDVRGDINIFDFGLARELPRKQKGSADSTFKLTISAGTPRYMAPEVASGKYNEACDIYSASLLLWEFITLKRPFKDQKVLEDFEKNVWCPNGARPKVSTKVPPGLQRLVTRSWSHNFNERPNAMEFEDALRSEISKLEEDSSEGEMDSELYSSTQSTMNLKTKSMSNTGNGKLRNSFHLATPFASRNRDGALLDPIGASVNTFLTTNSDQSGVCVSFRSEC